mgnify:CR=1 FL=1
MDHTLSTDVEPKMEPRRANSAKTSPVLAAVLVILGVLVMLYPVTSTLWNNHVATKAAQEYEKLEKSTPQEVKNTQWERQMCIRDRVQREPNHRSHPRPLARPLRREQP